MDFQKTFDNIRARQGLYWKSYVVNSRLARLLKEIGMPKSP